MVGSLMADMKDSRILDGINEGVILGFSNDNDVGVDGVRTLLGLAVVLFDRRLTTAIKVSMRKTYFIHEN